MSSSNPAKSADSSQTRVDVTFDPEHCYVSDIMQNRYIKLIQRAGSNVKAHPMTVKYIARRKLIGMLLPQMIVLLFGTLLIAGMILVERVHLKSHPGRFKVQDPVFGTKSAAPVNPSVVREFSVSIPWWIYIAVIYCTAVLMLLIWVWWTSRIFAITTRWYVAANLYPGWLMWLSAAPRVVAIEDTGPLHYYEPVLVGKIFHYGTFMTDGPTELDDWMKKVRYVPHVEVATGIAIQTREDMMPDPEETSKKMQEAVRLGVLQALQENADKQNLHLEAGGAD